MIRAIYRKIVPAGVRRVVWRVRQSLSRAAQSARVAYIRLRFGDRRRTMRKPDSHSKKTWLIETSESNTIRGTWLRKVVRGSVLDVGCGHGYATCDMARTASSIHAVDLTEHLVHRAEDLARLNSVGNVTFGQADAYSLPFDDHSFDTVTLLEILEHLEHPQRAVNEAIRVARERVVVSVPAQGHMTDLPGHIHDFELDELRGMFPGPVKASTREPFSYVVYDVNRRADLVG